jgi:hypothetical protein
MATFLLGAWMGCSLLVAVLVVANLNSPARTISGASPPAARLLQKLNDEDARLLLRYQAAEETRTYLYAWELAQIPLALALGGSLFLGTEKRAFPLVLCGVMLIFVLFQHFALIRELAYRGREADFPPGNRVYGTQMRLLLIQQVYAGMEAAKFVCGGILASYLFVFHASRRLRRKGDALGDLPISPANRMSPG